MATAGSRMQHIVDEINKIVNTEKKTWYKEAYSILIDTFGYLEGLVSSEYEKGFIEGYVTAKSLEFTTINVYNFPE